MILCLIYLCTPYFVNFNILQTCTLNFRKHQIMVIFGKLLKLRYRFAGIFVDLVFGVKFWVEILFLFVLGGYNNISFFGLDCTSDSNDLVFETRKNWYK